MTRVHLIIPTGVNLLTAVNSALVEKRKTGETPEIILPSLRRRALLVVTGVSTLPIHKYTTTDKTAVRSLV